MLAVQLYRLCTTVPWYRGGVYKVKCKNNAEFSHQKSIVSPSSFEDRRRFSTTRAVFTNDSMAFNEMKALRWRNRCKKSGVARHLGAFLRLLEGFVHVGDTEHANKGTL